MKTLYKAYENNPQLGVVKVIKDTGKTIHYAVCENPETMVRTERKETDWYKYFDTPQEAQQWLLLKVEARLIEALEEVNLSNKVKNAILDMEL